MIFDYDMQAVNIRSSKIHKKLHYFYPILDKKEI